MPGHSHRQGACAPADPSASGEFGVEFGGVRVPSVCLPAPSSPLAYLAGASPFSAAHLKHSDPTLLHRNQEVKDKDGTSLGEFTVPHANIHSCPTSAGACTPFVANSPGLSTHTAAEKLVLDAHGDTMEFKSDVELTPGEYTIIAHYRFFVTANPPTLCEDPDAGK